MYSRRREGSLAKFDNLPMRYRANIDTADVPFSRQADKARR